MITIYYDEYIMRLSVTPEHGVIWAQRLSKDLQRMVIYDGPTESFAFQSGEIIK